MARIVPPEEFDLIEGLIAEHPEGLGISALERYLLPRLSHPLHRRTLQRRLQRLLADKRISAEGQGLALAYKPSRREFQVDSMVVGGKIETVTLDLPVSREGGIIRDLLRQPLTLRKPVGYQRSFLEEYEPGVTFYLSDSLRTQFREIGQPFGGGRPAGTYAREILQRLLIDLAWASSRLEGNTYNRLDTRNLIEFGQAAEGKDILETQMILNHKAAIEMLVEEAEQVGFNSFTFLNLHALLSENLLRDEDACGRLRRRPVEISGTVFHPLAMPQVLEDCFHLLLRKAAAIPDPFEQAFFVMVQLPYLQPFEDVNKRVSRLGANISLIKNNLCPLSFVDVPEKAYVEGLLGVYEFNQVDLLRDVFIWAYERSCQRYLAITETTAEPDPLRIRYREPLIQAVQAIVRGRRPSSAHSVRALAEELVPEDAAAVFGAMVLEALQRLHEGNVARYRLKLSEYLAWKEKGDSRPHSASDKEDR